MLRGSIALSAGGGGAGGAEVVAAGVAGNTDEKMRWKRGRKNLRVDGGEEGGAGGAGVAMKQPRDRRQCRAGAGRALALLRRRLSGFQ